MITQAKVSRLEHIVRRREAGEVLLIGVCKSDLLSLAYPKLRPTSPSWVFQS